MTKPRGNILSAKEKSVLYDIKSVVIAGENAFGRMVVKADGVTDEV